MLIRWLHRHIYCIMSPSHVIVIFVILLITTYEASSQEEMDPKALREALISGKTLLELKQSRGTRIINGKNVDPPYKYPSIVGIYWNGCEPNKPDQPCKEGLYLCAGSIYNKNWIVTAAHCAPSFKPPGPGVLFVIAGIHDISKPPEPWTQNVTVVETIRHELFEKGGGNFVNDIALYRVKPPIKFSAQVAPMNIADFDFLPSGDYNTSGRVVGWGVQKKEPYNPVLQEAKVPLLTNSRCQRLYGWFNYGGKNLSVVVNQGMICAGELEGGTDACQGDSGGPLFVFYEPDDTWTQVGIVSFGNSCAEKDFPGIYTRIGYFTAWIETQIQNCEPRKDD